MRKSFPFNVVYTKTYQKVLVFDDNKFLTFSYKFRVMNLALPNVIRVLRTRYDMIALLL